MREDLLSLSDDDLVLLSNKGTLKRAQRDLEEVTLVELSEDAHKLWAIWSDEVTCTLDHDQPLAQATCTCPSPQLCRHILRTVLTYQRHHRRGSPAQPAEDDWLLRLSDDDLKAQSSAALRGQARRLLEAGELVELWVDARPWAMFHVQGHAVRFMVRGDLRYTRCSCEAPAPCVHAVAAVMAAHQAAQANQGIGRRYVDTIPRDPEQHRQAAQALERAEQLLSQWFVHGLIASPRESLDRLGRLVHQLKRVDHLWFAMIIEEFIGGCQRYLDREPHFMASELVALAGEFILRKDARAHTLEGGEQAMSPLPLICGLPARAARTGEQHAKTTLVGLGASVELKPERQIIQVLFQDQATGRILSVEHEQRPSEEDTDASWPKPYAKLAAAHRELDRPLSTLARHQIVQDRASHERPGTIKLSGAHAAAYHQPLKWEELGAPLLQTSFEALAMLLSAQAPRALRARGGWQDVYILSIAQLRDARFNEERQELEATLLDHAGSSARLRHRYDHLNAAGSELLLEALEDSLGKDEQRGQFVRFVFGPVKRMGSELCIWPLGVVIEDRHGARALLQPQIDGGERTTQARAPRLRAPKRPSAGTLIALELEELGQRLGDLLLLGLDRLEPRTLERLDELIELGVALDGGLLLGPLRHVRAQLEREDCDLEEMTRLLMEQCALYKLMHEAL